MAARQGSIMSAGGSAPPRLQRQHTWLQLACSIRLPRS